MRVGNEGRGERNCYAIILTEVRNAFFGSAHLIGLDGIIYCRHKYSVAKKFIQ